MNERIVLIGAGSAVFTRGLVGESLRRKRVRDSRDRRDVLEPATMGPVPSSIPPR